MATEDELVVNRRRRLPLWMSSSTPTPTPSSSTVASLPNSQENTTTTTTTTTTTLGKRSSRGKLCKKVILPDHKQQDSHHLHQISIPIDKQNKQQLVEDDDNNKGFKPKPKPNNKKKRIINKKTAPLSENNNKPKTHEDAYDVDEQQGEEEEVTLTVDDLIIIAQEYVNADYGKDYQQQVATEVVSRGSTSRYESSHGIQVLSTPIHTSVGPLSNSSPTSNQSIEEIIPNSSLVGDPAQDMLDLFLGPLLKKNPTERETYRDEEIASDNRFGKASDGEELGKQVPTLMKKKTSLRDKVAMLLD